MSESRIQNLKGENSASQSTLLTQLAEVRQAIYRGHPDAALYALDRLEVSIRHNKDIIYQVSELAQAIDTVIHHPSQDADDVITDIVEEIHERTSDGSSGVRNS